MGFPDYFPRYLLEFGSSVKTGVPLEALLMEGFKPEKYWDDMLSHFICTATTDDDAPWSKAPILPELLDAGTVQCHFRGSAKIKTNNSAGRRAHVHREFLVTLGPERTVSIGRITVIAGLSAGNQNFPGSSFSLRINDGDQLHSFLVYPFGNEMPSNQFRGFTGEITIIPPGAQSSWRLSCGTYQ